MKIIDADKLIEAVKLSPLIDFTDDDIIKLIDAFPETDMDERDADAFETGYIKGLSEQRPQGEWVRTGQSFVNPNKFRNYFCSKCFYELDEHIKIKLNFCPNCGAHMRGDNND